MLKASTPGTSQRLNASDSDEERACSAPQLLNFFEKMDEVEISTFYLENLKKLLRDRNTIAMWTFLNERKLTPLTEVGEQNSRNNSRFLSFKPVEDVLP